jgi:hypothetical protein
MVAPAGRSHLIMPDQGPKLTVHLETDEQGNPAVVGGDAKRHYKVVFEVENAPPDTYAATFELDSSRYDPVRTLEPERDGRFRLETTTFGDFPLVVRLHRAKAQDVVLKEGVVRGLKRARESMPANPEVDAALSDIANH